MKKRSIPKLALLALVLIPAVAQAWWNDQWAFRKQISVDKNTSVAVGESGNFPLLLRFHAGNFGYFGDLQADGRDLRFFAGDDQTPLKFHIEKFDPLNEMALIWVALPSSVVTNKKNFWMYYSNSDAKTGDDPSGIYDAHQVLVYEFNDQAAPRDQTAYGNQPSSFNAHPVAASLIGAEVSFDGKSTLAVASSPSLALDPAAGMSFSTWVRMDSPQQDAHLLSYFAGEQSLILGIDGLKPYIRYTAGGDQSSGTSAQTDLSSATWHHLALVAAKGKISLFVDGHEAGTTDIVMEKMQGALVLGAAPDGGHGFSGQLDELAVANVARSPRWFQTAVFSQGVDSKLVVYGEDQTRESSGGSSYFSVILHNVTIDGWVVILVLCIIAAISWVVMLVKGVVIRRVRKDNREFLGRFRDMSGTDPSPLDETESEDDRELQDMPFMMALFGHHDHFQNSTLYHVYHTGIQEIKRRAAATAGSQAATLSSQSLGAIRAALDATQVRETQKLNGQMVLLTLAISGGPFLGLLGTVVGVMITFAAIAASGDVNINAIAPGIAAALVATVAGLAVAIPALFGYNYLNSRIREITTDMRVFVDEFVSRLAEYHS